jgi:hypothetical protein
MATISMPTKEKKLETSGGLLRKKLNLGVSTSKISKCEITV